MKYSEFQRWLISQGVSIDKTHGKDSHRKPKRKKYHIPLSRQQRNRRGIKAKDT